MLTYNYINSGIIGNTDKYKYNNIKLEIVTVQLSKYYNTI